VATGAEDEIPARAALNAWLIAPNITVTSLFPGTIVQGADLNGKSVANADAMTCMAMV
jgi:hypothetical protein